MPLFFLDWCEYLDRKFLEGYGSDVVHVYVLQIGQLKRGLNPPSLTDLVFVSPYLTTTLKTGIIIGIITLAVSFHFLSLVSD